MDLCKVCSIEWDFVGKIEYFYEDINYLIKKLGIPKGRIIKKKAVRSKAGRKLKIDVFWI